MEWNVIVSVQEQGYSNARRFLHEYGRTMRTEYFNVLVMQVDDVDGFLEDLRTLYATHTPALQDLGRIVPVSRRFRFQDLAEFEAEARAAVAEWLDAIAGRRFYVRMHRRGFKGRLSSQEEERFLDHYILERLAESGRAEARVDFERPERVIAVETLGQEAGMSLWTREQMERYPFLKLA